MTQYYNVSIPVIGSEQVEVEERCFALGAESVTLFDSPARVVALTRTPDVFVDTFSSTESTPVEGWEHDWFSHFDGAELLPGVAIKAFDKALPDSLAASKYVIELDPRDAFGDGLHATTQLCARLCQEIVQIKQPQRVLDVGTGSGVLAIWLSLLGVPDIEGFDIEPLSVEKATQNCVRNGCPSIRISEGDIHTYSSQTPYDLVVANVLTSIVESSLDQLIALVAPGGQLVLSGIGAQWESEMLALLDLKGLNIQKKLELDGWLGIHCSL